MNKFFSLIRIQLKDFLGKTVSGLNIKHKSFAKLLIFLLPVLLSIPVYNLSLTAYIGFSQLGFPELVITMTYIGAVMLMFFLGIPFIVSIFFYSRDIQFLSALPIREDEIVFSKLSTVYIYLLLICIILMGPALLVYGGNIGFTFLYLIKSITVIFIAPLLPMLISAFVIMLMSGFLINSNRRNLFSIITNLILIIAIIGLQVMVSRFTANPEYLRTIMASEHGLLRVIGMRFPPSIWMTRMFLGSLKDGIFFLSLNIILLFGLQKLARIFYRKAIVSLQQGGQAIGDIYYKKHSRWYQLVKRHLLIILKEPTFLINTVLSLIVPLILFIVMSLTGQLSTELINSPQLQPYQILIFILIISAPAIVGNISATAITREGRTFWETKVLPISYRQNIQTRIYTTIIFYFVGAILMGGFSIYLLDLNLSSIIIGAIFAISVILFFAVIDLIINIYRPFLNWSNPTAAVKNNINVMLALGLRAVIAGIIYVVYKLFPGMMITNLKITIMIASLIFFTGYIFARYFIFNILNKRFREIFV